MPYRPVLEYSRARQRAEALISLMAAREVIANRLQHCHSRA